MSVLRTRTAICPLSSRYHKQPLWIDLQSNDRRVSLMDRTHAGQSRHASGVTSVFVKPVKGRGGDSLAWISQTDSSRHAPRRRSFRSRPKIRRSHTMRRLTFSNCRFSSARAETKWIEPRHSARVQGKTSRTANGWSGEAGLLRYDQSRSTFTTGLRSTCALAVPTAVHSAAALLRRKC
ncbi:hypothetical protein EJ03DRAFT_5270 [Teratosphaeria nubilosa]|uniref:Uncharacterized protein n=1 Tax=Teratosphaeria nubilosa TaxID=161662 RepID=A0A6G1LN19_9PEZI|nr:hypothetical protein EJ03DRAFT_5270 [Teratosphaeria nubilosa]